MGGVFKPPFVLGGLQLPNAVDHGLYSWAHIDGDKFRLRMLGLQNSKQFIHEAVAYVRDAVEVHFGAMELVEAIRYAARLGARI